MFRRALLLSLALAFLPGGLQPVEVAGQTRSEGSNSETPGIEGRVIDRSSRLPLSEVAVILEALDESTPGFRVLTVLTNPDGRFSFGVPPAGRFAIRVERLGYRTVRDSVTHRPELGLRMQVELAEQAVELEPLLVITEARSRALQANGFYNRQRRGLGYAVTRDEAALQRAMRTSDAFRMMPGVQVRPGGMGVGRGIVRLRGGCLADVYLDGTRTVSPFPVDDVLQPNDIEAIEIYRASEVPPQFGHSNCGVVLIWTYVPPAGAEGSWSWTKFFAAVGLFGMTLLFR